MAQFNRTFHIPPEFHDYKELEEVSKEAKEKPVVIDDEANEKKDDENKEDKKDLKEDIEASHVNVDKEKEEKESINPTEKKV